jgi:hypothetical protein
VFLDETLLTVCRILEMIKSPIKKLYPIVKKVYGYSCSYGTTYPVKVIDNIAYGKDKKPDNTTEDARRMNKCAKLMNTFDLPGRVTWKPYMDYILSNEKIKEGFHVVSSYGEAKGLEEWEWIFNSAKPTGLRYIWQSVYGKCERIYVKSGKGNVYYLAVNVLESTIAPMNAERVEENEKRYVKGQIEQAATEEANKTKAEEKLEPLFGGYCANYYEQSCTGYCGGDVGKCEEGLGPQLYMMGM